MKIRTILCLVGLVGSVSSFAMEIDESLSSEQLKLVESHLGLLDSLPRMELDERTLALFGFSRSTEDFAQWTKDRVKRLTTFESLKSLKVLGERRAESPYPEKEVFPLSRMYYPDFYLVDQAKLPNNVESEKKETTPEHKPKSGVVAANIGASMYGSCKQKDLACKVTKEEVELFKLDSPRVGFIALGEIYFDFSDYEAVHALVHEGRHSDGAGESLTFGHWSCPLDHPLAGIPACDGNLNGPYSIGAAFTKTLLNNWESIENQLVLKEGQVISDRRRRMEAIYLDNKSRVVESVKPADNTLTLSFFLAEYNFTKKAFEMTPDDQALKRQMDFYEKLSDFLSKGYQSKDLEAAPEYLKDEKPKPESPKPV